MSCKSKCSGGCLTCNDLIALGLILGSGVIFYSCFDEGLFATIIAILLILCLSC